MAKISTKIAFRPPKYTIYCTDFVSKMLFIGLVTCNTSSDMYVFFIYNNYYFLTEARVDSVDPDQPALEEHLTAPRGAD